MENVAIQVEHVKKVYKLYNKNSDRIKDALGLGKRIVVQITMRWMMYLFPFNREKRLELSEQTVPVNQPF